YWTRNGSSSRYSARTASRASSVGRASGPPRMSSAVSPGMMVIARKVSVAAPHITSTPSRSLGTILLTILISPLEPCVGEHGHGVGGVDVDALHPVRVRELAVVLVQRQAGHEFDHALLGGGVRGFGLRTVGSLARRLEEPVEGLVLEI